MTSLRLLRQATRLAVAAAYLLSAPSWALDRPVATDYDHRVRLVAYNPLDVIQVDTVLGTATLIELEPGEKYVSHAFGDSAAYDFAERGDRVLLKPRAEQADTNLIVLTDRRNYAFRLSYSHDRHTSALYKLTIRHPDTEREAARNNAQRQQVAQALDSAQAARNWQAYTMSGHRSIAPIHAWDDGASTWFEFAPGQELPQIYQVDADGQEVIANRHMANPRTVVVDRVTALWRLRLGQQVLAIHNEAAHHGRTQPLPTGTVSPDVKRVIREEPSQ